MTDSSVQDIADQLSKTSVNNDGVSFQGKSLKLNTEKDCDEVVKAINECKNLEYLNLEGNTLGVEASKAISKALETKSGLKRALWKDMFTGRMKEEIPQALHYLGNGLTLAGAQLTELDLSDNAFGPIGVKGLAGLLSSQACYQLQELKLNNTGLGISGGKLLAQALLKCHENSKKEGKTLGLKLFVAGRNRLENEGAAALAEVFKTLGTLEEIVMPQNGIYHKGIKAISNSLKDNPNLRILNLNDNTITEKGANHIAAALPYLQKLQVLNLGDCLLKSKGALVLADALSEKHSDLEELNLGYNEINVSGGLAVAKAVTNKSKLKELNVNGNKFGSEGMDSLKESLAKNEKLSTLGPLSDDEGCDDESSEEESDDECEEEEEENGEDSIEENGISPEKKSLDNSINKSFLNIEKKSASDQTSDILSGLLGDLSIKQNPSGTLKTFVDNPTLENFLTVEENKVYEFVKENENSSVDFYIDTFIPMLVKISSFSCCGNPKAMKLSSDISRNLYKNLFSWASMKNELSTVNNALFVHLGLIKSEDKSFKINWNVKGSLEALKTAISEGVAPHITESILKCCLETESNKKKSLEISID